MNHPHNVLFGPDNNLYVTNVQEGEHSVLRFDGRSGKYLGVFIDGKNAKIGYPSDVVFTQSGELLWVDCVAGSIVRYDGESGAYLGTLVHSGSGLPAGATSIVLIPK